MNNFKPFDPICSQHKLFLETKDEEMTVECVQVKPGDELSNIVVPVWSKITLHSVVDRGGKTIVWRLFSVETDLTRAAAFEEAKALTAKMEAVVMQFIEERNALDDTSNGSSEAMESSSYASQEIQAPTGEAPVASDGN